ncbi:MAG TPA: WbqC family protein [Puia sp.]|nr:WbqC family protein [Puia sp.]
MNLLTEIQYFPSIIFYKNSFNITNIVFEQYESYQKMSFRNRCLIVGAGGIIKLSIPLETGRDQKEFIRDVRIAEKQKWRQQHWRTISSCYNHSPWFDFYRDELAHLYERSHNFLFDWNVACFEWTVEKLKWPVNISFTERFLKNYDSPDWVDCRNTILPKNYHDVEPVKYHQVFEERVGFLPNLSVLDLLCCEGNKAGDLLMGK